ncbi:hypothetical protein [Trinickia acidisoli]|uniref:hypothetical protein n=1 Tax=Trinickia acidisoli TaxID=2767482 RepID=UPI001A8E648D|nr:hypothetical protein [Trinickia acidisoli]
MYPTGTAPIHARIGYIPDSTPPQHNPPPAKKADSGITAGNAHLVWGVDGHGVTATATLENNQNQTVGSVVVDHANDTVTVTAYDPSTGKPRVDPNTGKTRAATFSYVDGNIVNQGGLHSEDLAPDPDDYFTQGPQQEVTLQCGTVNTPAISVDVAYNLNGYNLDGSSTGLGVVISMPSKPGSDPVNPYVNDDELMISAGGLKPDGSFADPNQLTAQYDRNWASEEEVDTDYVSPMPPADHQSIIDKLFSWL